MSVHLFNEPLDVDLVGGELHLLAVLCAMLAICKNITRKAIDVLNLTATELGSVELRGRMDVVIEVPLDLASGGRKVRKRRAGLAQAEKGLNLAVTSVMNFVIILGGCEAQLSRFVGKCCACEVLFWRVCEIWRWQ